MSAQGKKKQGTERAEKPENQLAAFQRALEESESKRYVLRLYITGSTPRSMRAIESLRKVCEERLRGRYELQVIDIYQQKGLAKEANIIAAPTLIKKLPLPLRKMIGDMASSERILVGLDLKRKE